MAQQTNSNVALCPECEGPVRLSGKLQVGQRLPCHRCGSTLVIIDRKPLELDLASGSHQGVDYSKKGRKKDKVNATDRQNSEGKDNPKMESVSRVSMGECPECETTLRFHKSLKESQLLVCPGCNETLKVVSLRPLELSWANEDPWEYDNLQYLSHYG